MDAFFQFGSRIEKVSESGVTRTAFAYSISRRPWRRWWPGSSWKWCTTGQRSPPCSSPKMAPLQSCVNPTSVIDMKLIRKITACERPLQMIMKCVKTFEQKEWVWNWDQTLSFFFWDGSLVANILQAIVIYDSRCVLTAKLLTLWI